MQFFFRMSQIFSELSSEPGPGSPVESDAAGWPQQGRAGNRTGCEVLSVRVEIDRDAGCSVAEQRPHHLVEHGVPSELPRARPVAHLCRAQLSPQRQRALWSFRDPTA